MDSAISLRPLPDYVIRESSECCCGFRDFVVAIAGSCDQRVSQSVAVDSAILLRPLPDYVIRELSECCCGFRDFVAAVAGLCDQSVGGCCGFRDFVAAIAGLCDQRVSHVAVGSAISLQPLPDYVTCHVTCRVARLFGCAV